MGDFDSKFFLHFFYRDHDPFLALSVRIMQDVLEFLRFLTDFLSNEH